VVAFARETAAFDPSERRPVFPPGYRERRDSTSYFVKPTRSFADE